MKPFYDIRATSDSAGEILLYGPIESDPAFWDDEHTPLGFVQALAEIGEVDTLDIRINSPGGDVFAGQAIYSILSRHPARKVVTVDGLAASAASLVAMVGDEVVMPSNAMMMIHSPFGIAAGTADEHRKMAEALDKAREAMIAVYQGKTDQSRGYLIKMMDAETWLTAKEAKALGFADRVESRRVAAMMATDKLLVIGDVGVRIDRYENPVPVHLMTDGYQENADSVVGAVAAFATRTTARADHRKSDGRSSSDTDLGYWRQIRDTAVRVLEDAPTGAEAEPAEAREELTAEQRAAALSMYLEFAGS